ncbi:MAG: hypothetical protein JWM11_3844 [Planctomycetaceae bacterium]|nr:hypothetical protein [Planctomycetaceae bacterium]
MTEIARVRKEGHLRMSTYISGGDGTIVVEDFHPSEGFMEIQARVSGPHGRSQQVALKQVSPRRYQATLPLWGAGRYHVSAAGAGGDRKENCFGRMVVSYSPEYLWFRSNPQVIDEIVKRTGGQILTKDSTADDIYRNHRQPQRSSRPIFDQVLILLACLIPLDVALRRIQIDWLLIRSWFTSKKRLQAESTATMGALLQRRQAVKSELETRRGTPVAPDLRDRLADRRVTTSTVPVPDPTKANAESPGTKPQPKAAPDVETGTTGRLKALKRQREAEKKQEGEE